MRLRALPLRHWPQRQTSHHPWVGTVFLHILTSLAIIRTKESPALPPCLALVHYTCSVVGEDEAHNPSRAKLLEAGARTRGGRDDNNSPRNTYRLHTLGSTMEVVDRGAP